MIFVCTAGLLDMSAKEVCLEHTWDIADCSRQVIIWLYLFPLSNNAVYMLEIKWMGF